MPIDCEECRTLGDDYYLDNEGEWVSACDNCPIHLHHLDELEYEMLDFNDDSRED